MGGTGSSCTEFEKGLRNAIMLALGTPYCIGSVLAMLMNMILPADMEVVREVAKPEQNAESESSEAACAKEKEVSTAPEGQEEEKDAKSSTVRFELSSPKSSYGAKV